MARIEILRSQWDRKSVAISINNTRVAGPKAGPWTVEHSVVADDESILDAIGYINVRKKAPSNVPARHHYTDDWKRCLCGVVPQTDSTPGGASMVSSSPALAKYVDCRNCIRTLKRRGTLP